LDRWAQGKILVIPVDGWIRGDFTLTPGVMIAEIYEALVEAGTSKEKAKAAAGVVPAIDNLATKS